MTKKIPVNHKEEISQVNDFSTFLCMGRCKNLGSLKFFLRCAPNYLGALLPKCREPYPAFHPEFPAGHACQWMTSL